MSSVVSTAPGGEQITVKKTGGVGEVKRADPALKVNIEKDLEKEKLVELSSIQQAERMREEFELHKKLELEAEELAKLKEEQYLAEHSSAESLREAVEGLKLSELEFEKQRAECHSQAVAKENERVKLVAAEVLHKEEADQARKLAEQHREGQKYADAVAKQHEFEAQASVFRQKKLEAMEVAMEAQPIGTTVSPAHIDVQVIPSAIPVQREFYAAVPKTELATATIEESAPATASPPPMNLETEVKTEELHQKAEAEIKPAEQKQHSFASDVVGVIYDVVTGKK